MSLFGFSSLFFFYFIILYWFCHTSTWIRHRCTQVPHPEPPSHLPPHSIPLGHPTHQPWASCIMHQTWTGDSFHIWYYMFRYILPNHPILTLSHRVHKTVYTSVPLLLSRIQDYHYYLSKFHKYALVSISALLTMPKLLTVWITINCGKFWKRWEYQTTWPASWETCMQVIEQPLELDMEQQTGSK